MADKDDAKIDDIVARLDDFMQSGGGHMNIEVHEDGGVVLEKTVVKTQSNDCQQGMACQVPTLMQGLDADDDGE